MGSCWVNCPDCLMRPSGCATPIGRVRVPSNDAPQAPQIRCQPSAIGGAPRPPGSRHSPAKDCLAPAAVRRSGCPRSTIRRSSGLACPGRTRSLNSVLRRTALVAHRRVRRFIGSLRVLVLSSNPSDYGPHEITEPRVRCGTNPVQPRKKRACCQSFSDRRTGCWRRRCPGAPSGA
jgi:hypothetical protein